MTRLSLLALLALTALLTTGPAFAHDPFELTTEGSVGRDSLTLRVTMNLETARTLIERAAPHDVELGSELAALRRGPAAPRDVATAAGLLYLPVLDDRQLGLRAWSVSAAEPKDIAFTLEYDLEEGKVLDLEATHLEILSTGYTSALRLAREPPAPGGTPSMLGIKLLHPGDPSLKVELAAQPDAKSEPAPSDAPAMRSFAQFFELGAEHMLTGYDHLLFLMGIVLVCTGLKSMLVLVSGFTVAHSISLAAAAFGSLSLPSSLVEILIAASIVYVGVENLVSGVPLSRRAALTFAFGLVHGLGFAGVLRELWPHTDQALIQALLAFNLGLEVAQLALAALVLPALVALRSRGGGARPLRFGSFAVSAVGGYWLVTRTAELVV